MASTLSQALLASPSFKTTLNVLKHFNHLLSCESGSSLIHDIRLCMEARSSSVSGALSVGSVRGVDAKQPRRKSCKKSLSGLLKQFLQSVTTDHVTYKRVLGSAPQMI